MKSLIPLAVAAVLAAALPLSADANSDRVYRWTDSNGVTHYSDSPPPTGQYQEVGTRAARPPAEQAPAEPSPECRRARENLEKLTGGGEIQMQDDEGNAFTLNAAQVEAQIRIAEAAINAYCD